MGKPSPGVFLQVHVVTPVVLEGYKTIILSSVSLSCVLYLDHHFRLQLAILRSSIWKQGWKFATTKLIFTLQLTRAGPTRLRAILLSVVFGPRFETWTLPATDLGLGGPGRSRSHWTQKVDLWTPLKTTNTRQVCFQKYMPQIIKYFSHWFNECLVKNLQWREPWRSGPFGRPHLSRQPGHHLKIVCICILKDLYLYEYTLMNLPLLFCFTSR